VFRQVKKMVKGRIELYFVDSEQIKKLNKKYRGKDKVTDVLSFSFLEGEHFPGEDLVGEIFIDPITAKKQAESHGMKWQEELEFLFVHALLHVFGYDHENKRDFRLMFGLQAQIMPDRKWGRFVEQIYRESFGE
ncbi:rRNA maturation RNase YbeY, partial [Candidatus Peregrinibacteria bacterium]|nr:rRNA maturation RNase YbeY [Candidatus Peregrinibacteria bacterium]